MNNNEVVRELRYIRGLLIHTALLIATIGLYMIMEDFKITDLVYVVLLIIQSLGVTAISLKSWGRIG